MTGALRNIRDSAKNAVASIDQIIGPIKELFAKSHRREGMVQALTELRAGIDAIGGAVGEIVNDLNYPPNVSARRALTALRLEVGPEVVQSIQDLVEQAFRESMLDTAILTRELICHAIYVRRADWNWDHPNKTLGIRALDLEAALRYVRANPAGLESLMPVRISEMTKEEVRDLAAAIYLAIDPPKET